MRMSIRRALLLTAALAIGLAIARNLVSFVTIRRDTNYTYFDTSSGSAGSLVSTPSRYPNLGTPASASDASYWFVHLPYWAGPGLAAMTLVTLASPSRAIGRRRRPIRPGRLAGLAVVAAMGGMAAECLVSWFSLFGGRAWGSFPIYLCHFWAGLPGVAGGAVAIAWASLALARRWRRADDQTEWLGRLFGVCWIGSAACGQIGLVLRCSGF